MVIVTPVSGGPRPHFDASIIVDLARCESRFVVADLWDERETIEFPPTEVRRLGAAIEASIPDSEGRFSTQWVAAAGEPDALLF
ncbi:hypothetical protein [Pseudorhodoferax soli]|uniref:Uncharacterized protein n=1 Tax=Pseudorhodoferax soli TaxID=545864 RepID=A0A368Y0V4_9BURK|nr:hypothetical protein [Pseudorhodoferax soli]RCW73832.1 hypothetical protein DES41_102146 [Pseudorhodoferax soli]